MHKRAYNWLRLIILSLLTMVSSITYAYDFEVDGLCYNIIANDQVEVTYKTMGGYSGTIQIPESVKYNNMEYRVTSIGSFAFYECMGLTGSLIFPNSIVTIEKQAFSRCINLTGSLIIPNSVTSIGGGAFYGCEGLTGELIIPNSVTTIGNNAFYGCKGFTGELRIPESVTFIGSGAFYNCEGFTGSIIIPSSISEINNFSFYGCKGITSLVIPNTTRKIIYYAFAECKGLVNVTLGTNITVMKQAAFNNCEKLENVYSYIENPFSIEYNTFQGISPNAILYVPKGTKAKYDQFVNWTCFFKDVVEEDGVDKHILNIKATGYGLVSYNGSNMRDDSRDFYVEEGSSVTISFVPDDGYRIKTVEVNGERASVNNNSLTLTMNEDVNVEVVFEEIPKITYNLTIVSKGNGYASFDGETIREEEKTYTVYEGSDVTVSFTPDTNNRISSVKVNGVETNIDGNIYTITNVNSNNSVDVTFEELEKSFIVDDVSYDILSYEDRTLKVGAGDYGFVLEVPEIVTYQNEEWIVTGVTDGALDNCRELAAVIWNLDGLFNISLANSNLLLYVKDEAYAPPIYKNVVVNGNAQSITLTDAMSGNNFYCPMAFTTRKIEYTHSYYMKSGLNESRGWETIALPFDVQKISHSSKGEIVPFARWTSDSSKKPFWLYEMSSNGFVEAEAIKANTPYIISMPNNEVYPVDYQLTGRVTFSAENVEVKKSDDVQTMASNGNTFKPSFINLGAEDGYYALNVNNDYEYYQGAENEGSMFILNLRKIHPFEAYMTSNSGTRTINVFDGTTTAIRGIEEMVSSQQTIKVYDLSGRLIKTATTMEAIKQELPIGVYIVNNKKMIIK